MHAISHTQSSFFNEICLHPQMYGVLGKDSALKAYTRPRTLWANKMID